MHMAPRFQQPRLEWLSRATLLHHALQPRIRRKLIRSINTHHDSKKKATNLQSHELMTSIISLPALSTFPLFAFNIGVKVDGGGLHSPLIHKTLQNRWPCRLKGTDCRCK